MAFTAGTLTGTKWYPAGFTRVGGRDGISLPWDDNFVALGVTVLPLKGDYYGTTPRGNIHHWELRTYDSTLGKFVVSYTGGAISSGASTFTIPSWVSARPRWCDFTFYDASNARIGGGFVYFHDKTNDWPTSWWGLTGRIGMPFNRTEIDDAASPAARWAEIDADLADQATHVNPAYSALDATGRARAPKAYVAFRNYGGSAPELAGITATAAHWQGQGILLGPDNERNGTPDAADAPREIARCRAIWAGDPAATVVIGDGVTFNEWGRPRLRAFLLAVKAGLTSGEWAKVVLGFHDYNTQYDDLVTGDYLWTRFKALADEVGIQIWADTEENAFEAAHVGSGNLLHQLAQASTSVLIHCAYGIWRERQFLYYPVQRGQADHTAFMMNEGGQPFPVMAWLVQLEQATRNVVSMQRLAAGDDSPTVLAVRFLRADGSGTVAVKACGRERAPLRFSVAGASSVELVSWEGERVSMTVAQDGSVDVEVGSLPSHLAFPAGATVELVPTRRDPALAGGRWISSRPGAGLDRPPMGLDHLRAALAFSIETSGGGAWDEWHTRDPFQPGDYFGVVYPAHAPLELSAVEIHASTPRQRMPTIKKAKLEYRGLDGVWRTATRRGQPVAIDEPYPLQIAPTTPQDGTSGQYLAYHKGTHNWVLQTDPTPATGWRLVVGNPGDAVDSCLTAGEAPTYAAWTAGLPTVKGDPENDAYINDYAGFGTSQPRIHLRGTQAYGTPYISARPLVNYQSGSSARAGGFGASFGSSFGD